MRPYDDMNQGLKSLNNKIKLPIHEQQEILSEINQKMDQSSPKSVVFQWKYYVTAASVLILFIIIAIPLWNQSSFNQAGNHLPEPSPGVSGENSIPSEEEISIRIVNQTKFNISHAYLKIYHDGKWVQSQGSANADNSAIELGDTFDYSFYESEMGEGKYEVELELSNGSSTSYSTSRILLNVTGKRDYTLQIKGDSIMNAYLVNPMLKKGSKSIANMEEFKKKLKVALTENEVKKVLGNEYTTEKSAVDGIWSWRFDFGTIGGYAYDNQGNQNGADIHGMENGIIQAQLFIEWDADNKVESYTLFYLDQKGEEIHYYYVQPDGSTTTSLLCSFEEEYGWNCPG
jgi:hypothetical protein